MQSLSVDSEGLRGSISTMLATPSERVTADDTAEVDTANMSGGGGGAYYEVQLASVMLWSPQQRTFILLEQFLASNDDGQYHRVKYSI